MLCVIKVEDWELVRSFFEDDLDLEDSYRVSIRDREYFNNLIREGILRVNMEAHANNKLRLINIFSFEEPQLRDKLGNYDGCMTPLQKKWEKVKFAIGMAGRRPEVDPPPSDISPPCVVCVE